MNYFSGNDVLSAPPSINLNILNYLCMCVYITKVLFVFFVYCMCVCMYVCLYWGAPSTGLPFVTPILLTNSEPDHFPRGGTY